MKSFRAWFTPGSLVAALFVALLWLHQIHIPHIDREVAQIALLGLTFVGLWALVQDRSTGG